MSRNRTPLIRLSRLVTWRQALVSVLIALTAFAPIARAACGYEHVANAIDGIGTHTHGASDDADKSDSSALESCCSDRVDAISEHVRTAAVDASVGPTTPTLHTPFASFSSSSRHGVRSDLVRPRHPSPPPESAFRRVPKLLI
jgi:hypothetical protein